MVLLPGRLTLKRGRTVRGRLGLVVALITFVWLLTPAWAAVSPQKVKLLCAQAEAHERLGDWEKACAVYEKLLSLDRNLTAVRERYRFCLRRYHQVLRHRDATYLNEVLPLKYTQAVRLYEIVLHNLLDGGL